MYQWSFDPKPFGSLPSFFDFFFSFFCFLCFRPAVDEGVEAGEPDSRAEYIELCVDGRRELIPKIYS